MSEQAMMLGVPPGTEPAPPVAPPKKERKPRSRAIVPVEIAGVQYTVAMRDGNMTVRRRGKHNVDSKSVLDVAQYVMGQGDLFNTLKTGPDEDVLDALVLLSVEIERSSNSTISGSVLFALNNALRIMEEKAPEKLKEARL